VTINYIYDPLSGLKEANISNGDYYHYTYDAVGNRVSQTAFLSGVSLATGYVYDNANRLSSVNGVTYTWDNNGNRLKSITQGANTSTFGYNGLGDRLTQNGVNYKLDLNTGLTQVLNDGTNTYLYGMGHVAQINGSNTDYFLGDALGSVRQMTDASPQINYARVYDPYGTTSQTYGASQTAYGFTGELTDPSGLIYLRARYYQSITGRFTTKDTFEGNPNIPISLNHFAYAHNNPVMNTDPSGHCVFAVVDTLLCSLVLGAAGGYFIGGGLAGWIWDSALEGKCGCTETRRDLGSGLWVCGWHGSVGRSCGQPGRWVHVYSPTYGGG